ncbi:MAG: DUF3160 domain-containing protein [Patescibacteria group bacterium]|nr:DUF3160 domain-containing protein [Patescibacteria group bacterium]
MDNPNQPQLGPEPSLPLLTPRVWYRRPFVWFIVVLILVLVAAAAAWRFGLFRLPKNSGTPQQAAVQPGYQEQLASLKDVGNYQAVLDKYGIRLTQAQQQYLQQNKFLLVEASSTNLGYGGYDEMLDYYDKMGGNADIYSRTPGDAVLVTPDVVLHAYHKFFDLALKDIERHQLSDALKQFTLALYNNVAAQAQQSGAAQAHYQKILAQLTVARVLLENQAPPKPDYFQTREDEANYQKLDSQDTLQSAKTILAKYSGALPAALSAAVEQELQDIYEAKTVALSPLFGAYNPDIQADYTQYTPRSHYTEDSALRAYFRTMMYFGRNAYYFKTNDGVLDAALVDGLMAVRDSATGVVPSELWQKISSITDFFVGQSDDIGYGQFTPWLSKVAPGAQDKITAADSGTINQLAANIWQLPGPQILSDVIISPQVPDMTKNDLLRQSAGFRIFSQKFTFDAWVLNQLTAGQEQADVKLPSTPSALFIPASFGDAAAAGYAKQFLKQSAGFSDQAVSAFGGKLAGQSAALAQVTPEQWAGSLGSEWLYLLSSLTQPFGSNYPLYMQSPNFPSKQIQTYLGSYTELKHDTLLYAKQSYAEKGGGGGDEQGPPPPVVKGFVEPNLDFWNRLNDFLVLTQKMFNNNGLSQSQMLPRLQNFLQQTQFFAQLAKQELQNQPISDDDYEKLRKIKLSYMAQPLELGVDISDPNQLRSALVADVHTDALTGQVLYEATGQPYVMLALVGDGGSPRLAAGVAFNHYEFTGPLGGNRLTDEDWRSKVYENPSQLPQKNFWYQPLVAK